MNQTYKFRDTEVYVRIKTQIVPNRIELIEVETGEPYAVATSVLQELNMIEGYVAVKDYSENTGMLRFLIDNDIVEPPVTFLKQGFVDFPICKIKTI